jgi:subtilase family serine protease
MWHRTHQGAASPRQQRMPVVPLISVLALLAVVLPGDASHLLALPRGGMTTAHAVVQVLPAPSSRVLPIALVLRGREPEALARLVTAISTPGSAAYRHYLTPDAFAQRFGPTAAERAYVAQVLQRAHFTLPAQQASDILLLARGTVAQIETFFHVRLHAYRATTGEPYVAANGAPQIPVSLQSSVVGVLGLDTRPHLLSHPLQRPLASSASIGGGLAPADLARAYDLTPLQAQGLDGRNQTIALAEIDTFHASDIAAYDQAFGITAPAITVVPVAGGASGTSLETPMDIEVLHAVAPHAHLIVYEGPSDLASLAQMFNQIVTEHRAQVLSISLGICEIDGSGPDSGNFVKVLNSTFQQADAEGMSVLVASGDSGAYGCQSNALSVILPASNPNVTAVGGTTLFLQANGDYDHEASWEGPLEGVGSGGGVSQIYSRPAWQTGISIVNATNAGMRLVPDVAADADPLSGYLIYDSIGHDIFGRLRCDSGGCWQVGAGTSAAAPFWAGLIALANQEAAAQGKSPLGFLNPTLYALAQSSRSPAPFHDVTEGGNLYYTATPGWDPCTGWGSPDAAVLVPDLITA